jgi:penicillin-binding protein 1A
MKRVTGGSIPATIWQKYMADIHTDLPIISLNAPPPHLLSENDEGLAAFYNELAITFSALETDLDGF